MLCLDKDDRTNEKNNLFKIIPPHQEKGWGESVSYTYFYHYNYSLSQYI